MEKPTFFRKRVRDKCFPRPYTTQELLLVVAELNYYEAHGCYSPTATTRVKSYANRIRRTFPSNGLTYEEKKQRLQDAIFNRLRREEQEG